MEKENLQEFVQRVWDSTPRGDASARFSGYDDDLELVGNRAGLLRLAAELVVATYASANPEYLFKSDHRGPMSGINKITLDEAMLEPPKVESGWSRWRNRLVPVGCLLVLVFAAICAIVGLYTIVKAL